MESLEAAIRYNNLGVEVGFFYSLCKLWRCTVLAITMGMIFKILLDYISLLLKCSLPAKSEQIDEKWSEATKVG